jgi:CBS domain-containing protein
MTPIVQDIVHDLDRLRVGDAMTEGVLTCSLDTPLREVAGLMAERRVHCVVACDSDEPAGALWGVVSDRDLVAAASARDLDGRTAGSTAATPALTVAPDETLERAAQLLNEHAVAHLIVVASPGSRPVGVLSTHDVARAAAEGAGGKERRGR